jgi:hypothetical protein
MKAEARAGLSMTTGPVGSGTPSDGAAAGLAALGSAGALRVRAFASARALGASLRSFLMSRAAVRSPGERSLMMEARSFASATTTPSPYAVLVTIVIIPAKAAAVKIPRPKRLARERLTDPDRDL